MYPEVCITIGGPISGPRCEPLLPTR